MTKAQRNRQIARALYLSGKDLQTIAALMGVTERTVSNYRAADAKEGNDWESARLERHISSRSRDGKSLYGDFVAHMYDQLQEIRDNQELTTQQRIDAIARLGDSFAKMRRIAAAENPEAYAHGIVKLTLSRLLTLLRDRLDRSALETIADTIAEHAGELADVSL